LQEVLEKFEFFPIKCRILRTAARYRQFLEEEAAPDAEKERRKLKTKVLLNSRICLKGRDVLASEGEHTL
jgi:hypothetical protein